MKKKKKTENLLVLNFRGILVYGTSILLKLLLAPIKAMENWLDIFIQYTFLVDTHIIYTLIHTHTQTLSHTKVLFLKQATDIFPSFITQL